MTWTPAQQRLCDWEAKYSGRRTVAAQMLEEARRLIDLAVDEAVAEHRGRVEMLEEQHARELERAEQRETRQRDRADRAVAAEKAYREQQTNLRERRETVEDGVQVRISAPRFPGYGDRTHPRPWTLGELETISYRLRSAGATDDTEVRFAHEQVEACVPFPEMVLEPRREPDLPAPHTEPARPVPWRPTALRIALVPVVAALVALLVVVIA